MGEDHGLHAVAELQLGEQVSDVRLHGGLAHHCVRGDAETARQIVGALSRPLSRRVASGQYGQFTGGSSSIRTVSQPPVGTVLWITSSGSRVPTKTSVSFPPWQ